MSAELRARRRADLLRELEQARRLSSRRLRRRELERLHARTLLAV